METEFIPEKKFMLECFRLAKIAYDLGEVPVGAVVELNGEIIGFGYNQRETLLDPTAHAEVIAMKMASENLKTWRLCGANLYVSLEPCPMCTGTAFNAKIKRIIFAAHDENTGCLGGKINLSNVNFNHKIKIYRGFMESESKAIIKDFFAKLR